MTWTTEDDPPPPRPIPGNSEAESTADDAGSDTTKGADATPLNVDGADPDDTETSLFPEGDGETANSDSIERDFDTDLETIDSLAEGSLAEGNEVSDNEIADDEPDLDKDGPLDPAVFDGLFDDLADDSDSVEQSQADQPENSSDLNDDLDDSQRKDHIGESKPSEPGPSELEAKTEPATEPATESRWTMPSPSTLETPSAAEIQPSPLSDDNDYSGPAPADNVASESKSGLFDREPQSEEKAPEERRPVIHGDLAKVQSDVDRPNPVSFDDHRQPSQELRPKAPRPPSTSSKQNNKWLGIAAAVALGSALGLLGTVLLSSLRDSPAEVESSQNQSEPTPSDTDGADVSVVVDPDTATTQDSELTEPGLAKSFGADAIQFGPGMPDLSDQDRVALDRLTELLNSNPETTATISVRSYSAETSAANYDLSSAQSGAITNYLTSAGVSEDQFNVLSRGSAPFRPSQPVDGFVVINPGIGQSDFKTELGPLNPFSVGLERGTSTLRPDSMAALDRVGEAMTTIESARVTLAAYSFSETNNETNKAWASQAVQVASQYLQETHGIDVGRISTIAPGAAEYQIDSAWSNHVEIIIEDDSKPAFEIAGLDASKLTFEANSELLTAEGQALLDEVAADLTSSDATLVAEVFSFSAADQQANEQLSNAQANSISTYLTAQGVPERQVRTFGGGAAKQFEVIAAPTAVALYVVS